MKIGRCLIAQVHLRARGTTRMNCNPEYLDMGIHTKLGRPMLSMKFAVAEPLRIYIANIVIEHLVQPHH